MFFLSRILGIITITHKNLWNFIWSAMLKYIDFSCKLKELATAKQFSCLLFLCELSTYFLYHTYIKFSTFNPTLSKSDSLPVVS